MICFSMHGQMTKVANSCICLSQQLEYETFHSLCHELLADPSHWHMRHEKNIFKLISLLDTKLFALTSDTFLEEYYRTQCHSVVGLQITPGWRARSASFPRGVRGHAPPGKFWKFKLSEALFPAIWQGCVPRIIKDCSMIWCSTKHCKQLLFGMENS